MNESDRNEADFNSDDGSDADEDALIPEGLSDQWKRQEQEGRRAGVCFNCGWTFAEEQLSCAHCGESVELPSNSYSDTLRFFFTTPWGWVSSLIFVLFVIAYFRR